VGVELGLARLGGYPFEVRYSDGMLKRATVAGDVAAAAYVFFSRLFLVEPAIAVIVADEADWPGRKSPYGMPFFTDDASKIRPGVVVMPAGGGDFWFEIGQDLRDASPRGYRNLLAIYPDGAGGVDLQPFFDLMTIHELGHAFEVLGDLRLPTAWLSEIFVNLAMHAFVATQLPASLPTLATLPTVGASSRKLAARMRAEGYSTLEELEAHYTGGDDPMSPLNYVWFQYAGSGSRPGCSRSTAKTGWPLLGMLSRHRSRLWRSGHGGGTGTTSCSRSQPHARASDRRLALDLNSRARFPVCAQTRVDHTDR
jgi:hypothetical protein